jgi:hypothetical protein
VILPPLKNVRWFFIYCPFMASSRREIANKGAAMSKLILTVLLGAVSSSAMAEWVPIAMSSDKTNTIYADPDTVRRSSDTVKLSIMNDNKTPKSVPGFRPYFSTKDQFEVDCNEDQIRMLGLIAYSGNMGKGEVIYTHKFNNDWSPVSRDTVDQGIFNFACGMTSI